MPSELDYRTSGRPGGPVLLLIHAMGADRTFWDACCAIWDEHFRCVAVDLRGVGASPLLDRPATIDAQAADLEQLRETLDLERVVPVGCAVGAVVAATYAGRFAKRSEAVVLSNPGFRTRPEAREMLQRRANLVRREGMTAVSGGTADAAFGEDADAAAKRAFVRTFEGLDASSYAYTIEGMLDADVSGWLAEIRCPALIVAGQKDVLLPPEDHAMPLHRALARSEYVSVPTGTHFIPYQQPDMFARLVSEFLRRRIGSRSVV